MLQNTEGKIKVFHMGFFYVKLKKSFFTISTHWSQETTSRPKVYKFFLSNLKLISSRKGKKQKLQVSEI